MTKSWQEIAADKRARIEKTIPSEWRIDTNDLGDNVMDVPAKCGLLSEEELAITNSSAVDLVARISKGDLKAVTVTTAFCKRAAIAQQVVWIIIRYLLCTMLIIVKTNCALEFFPEMALAQAKELDAYYEKNGKTVGPLHGLPISLKDQLRVKVCT
jgi:amidase